MPTPAPSAPMDGYMMNGKPYVFIDKAGTAAPAMRGPGGRGWVPDPQAMAQAGMKQLGSNVAAPEDDAELKTAVAAVDPARKLSQYADRFENLRAQLTARGQQTGPQWLPAPVAGKSGTATARRSLASQDPESEGYLEQMEGLTGTMWPLLKPEKAGTIRTTESGGGSGDGLVSMPDPGWKTAVPNIGAVGSADAGMRQGFRDDYVDASNRADFLQNFVHGGQGTAAAGNAVFDNWKTTPDAREELAAGKHVALGAKPGDFSGRTPGWSKQLPPKQLAAAQLYPNASAYTPGHYKNPWVPTAKNQMDALYAQKPGSYYVNSNGIRVRLPGAAPQGVDYGGAGP
jgi:hypothetical protein